MIYVCVCLQYNYMICTYITCEGEWTPYYGIYLYCDSEAEYGYMSFSHES